jgi:hypothetical protein
MQNSRLNGGVNVYDGRPRKDSRGVLMPECIIILSVGVGLISAQRASEKQRVSTQGYAPRPSEGEHLIRNAGSIFIKEFDVRVS